MTLDYVLTMCVVIPATFIFVRLLTIALVALFRFASDAMTWMVF